MDKVKDWDGSLDLEPQMAMAAWMFNPLYSDGFSHTDTYNMNGMFTIYFKGSQVEIFK